MNIQTPTSRFYKQVDDFKTKLQHILFQLDKHNEIVEMNKHYDKMMFVKSANAKLVIELFYKYVVVKYAKEILNEDESFFLGKLTNIKSGENSLDENDVMLIGHIRNIWGELPDTIKKNIWSYVKIISKLAETAVGGNALC